MILKKGSQVILGMYNIFTIGCELKWKCRYINLFILIYHYDLGFKFVFVLVKTEYTAHLLDITGGHQKY